ncbi:choice-of-anchor Q domain-containing protein [Streptomyces sp. SID13031]|uniref:choice-of-anchor Q domain-containing protein n=1 Tax=Streptomyces sp. SID13031 TaxID=2706046 RepID=UPI0013CB3B8A|nr:choice-of-anchor Q domain-containing protein [Streptomyces sp. SID13031]NEA31736.1 hypothetical protein [Streptomyces sp. SID13031]
MIVVPPRGERPELCTTRASGPVPKLRRTPTGYGGHSGISGISIINNTIANNPKPGILGASAVSGSGNVVRNTIFAGNSTGIGGPFSSDPNLTSDPGFIDPGNGDYHLREGSSAIDAGSASGAPATDRDGVARPQGNGYDVGAYEGAGGGGPTDPPPTGDWDPRQPGPNDLFTATDGSANYFRSAIGANPRLDPNSSAIVNSMGSNTPRLNGPEWQITVFTSSNSDPVYDPEFSEDWVARSATASTSPTTRPANSRRLVTNGSSSTTRTTRP